MSKTILESLKTGAYAERNEAYRLLETLEHDDPKQYADLSSDAKSYGFANIDEYIASLTINDIITGVDPSRSRRKYREKILDIVHTHTDARQLDERTNVTSFKTKTILKKITPQFIVHVCGRIFATSIVFLVFIACIAYIAMGRTFQNLGTLPVVITMVVTLLIVSTIVTISEMNTRRLTDALRNSGVLESEIDKRIKLDLLAQISE